MSLSDGLHPDLLTRITQVLQAMSRQGHPMRICQGVRTAVYQHSLWQQGRETPGHIVTNCDGYVLKSNHQAAADGYGHAVDCCFEGADPWAVKAPSLWMIYGREVEKAGLTWGGSKAFIAKAHFVDSDHAELPFTAPSPHLPAPSK